MRKLMGGVVLVAGVGGLGWYGSANNAETMQAEVTKGAMEVASTSEFGVQTDVSGRDITASGLVRNQAEFDTIRAALDDVEGRRVVDMAGVTLLPVADPFEMSAARDDVGATTLSGVIGSEDGRALVAEQAGELADGLVLSAGRPDATWGGVGASGLAALATLKSGEMMLSGQNLTLTGVAANPAQRDAALGAIGDLPEGYSFSDDITLEDDGTPLRLTLTRAEGAVSGMGKVPAALTAVADNFEASGDIDLIEAGPIMDGTPWDGFAMQGVAALNEIEEGVLTIEDTEMTLTGTATPDGVEAAQAALMNLPEGYSATTDLSFVDDGLPFSLDMAYDGEAVTASGKYPAEFTPETPSDASLTDEGRNAFISDDTAFTANADAGISALGLLENGTLMVTADEIVLSGLAATPDVEAAIAETLAAAPDGVSVQQDLTFLDDGSPAAWSVEYLPEVGGDISGKLPQNVDAGQIAEAMSLSDVAGEPIIALAGDELPEDGLSSLAIASEYLPEAERLTYSTSPEGTSIDMVLSPGVNADLVAADLAERLPAGVDLSATALDVFPDEGTIRTNVAKGMRERFQFGNWLPILTFAPVEAVCREQTKMALQGSGISFITGSSDLDAKSVRALNALAAIAQRCIDEGGLSLEVGGHTDSVGDEFNNLVLSENRADSVRGALVARGVDRFAVRAVGYGQSNPIADNGTEEGRAANRRTEFTWSN